MDFEVDISNLFQCRHVGREPADPAAGDLVARVESFAFTANNVTYALMGEAMRYWSLFPASEPGWGRIPVWGHATVVASAHPGVPEGTRVYGYLPMSTQVTLTPGRLDAQGFSDVAPHRASMAPAYNRYALVGTDPLHEPAREDHRMILWPLFFTGFLIDDVVAELRAGDGAAPSSVVLSSASSKTAVATAYCLAARGGVDVVGLTSGRNVAFVSSLGVYGRVVPYDGIELLPAAPAVFVDVAGDAEARRAVHRRYGDRLVHSLLVGATHWDRPPPADVGEPLPGPAPSFFFAPDRIAARTREWGAGGLAARVGDAWRRFLAFTDGWLEIRHGHGPAAVERAYREVLEGRSDPAVGHVLSLSER